MSDRRRGAGGERAQSESVSALLATLLVVVATVSAGTVLVFHLNQQIQAAEEPSEFAVDIDRSTLTVTHLGGRDFALADLELALRRGETERRYDLGDPDERTSDALDADDRFQGGESITVSHAFDGEVRALLVDASAGGAVLYDEREAVPGTASSTPASAPTSTPGRSTATSAPTSASTTASASTTTTPTPAPDPALRGYRLQDASANSNAEYTLFYDVENAERLDRVEVAFDNRNSDWGDRTVTGADPRGNVTFSQGGERESTYGITIRVYDVDGAVADAVAITDVADGDSRSGGDVTREDSPEFAGTAIDDLGGDEANYEVSYNVTNRSDFGSVRVRYENLDSEWASATYASAEPRDNVDDYAEASFGGTAGDEYRVTVQLLDSAGVVVDERVAADVADGVDPAGNADLGRATSPTLTGATVRDRSRYGSAAYRIQYRVSDPSSEFARAEALVRNVDSGWASDELSSASANGDFEYSQGGAAGDEYRLTVRVVDADGVVVDEYVVSDVADGADPSGTG